MFSFVTKKLFFLRKLPFSSNLFDSLLKVKTALINPEVMDLIDELEKEISECDGIQTKLHKYGGIEFQYRVYEVGHIHGNGLLDIRFPLSIKEELLNDSLITHHHKFRNSGWISLLITDKNSQLKASALLQYSLQLIKGTSK